MPDGVNGPSYRRTVVFVGDERTGVGTEAEFCGHLRLRLCTRPRAQAGQLCIAAHDTRVMFAGVRSRIYTVLRGEVGAPSLLTSLRRCSSHASAACTAPA